MDLHLTIEQDVQRALAEDVGTGDVTAQLVPDSIVQAQVISRQTAVLCGSEWFDGVFGQLSSAVKIHWQLTDGEVCTANQVLCQLTGPARALLAGERTALNFLQTLSGTATRTYHYVQAIQGTKARILDTRKTIPGLRRAQKYAVACGGGTNHRMGLYDAILIKENHIEAAGSIADAVANARNLFPKLSIEVEVETLDELHQAITADVNRVLLDNFSVAQLQQATLTPHGKIELEASGGITLDNIRAIAQTGVDFISIGTLTKDLESVDLSMRF
jgi:nicotinate-nucleotide pyrophosphorylase (carboxylating)